MLAEFGWGSREKGAIPNFAEGLQRGGRQGPSVQDLGWFGSSPAGVALSC